MADPIYFIAVTLCLGVTYAQLPTFDPNDFTTNDPHSADHYYHYSHRGEGFENLCHPYCKSSCNTKKATCFDIGEVRNCDEEHHECYYSCEMFCGCIQKCRNKCDHKSCDEFTELFTRTVCEGRHSACKEVCKERCPNSAFTNSVAGSLHEASSDIDSIFDSLNQKRK